MNSSDEQNEPEPETTDSAEATSPTENNGGEPTLPTEAEQLAIAIAERDQSQEVALRAKAELENFRRRSQKETGEMLKFAEIGFVRDLLPGLDNLRRALVAAEQTSDVNELLKGVNMVLDQLEGTLASHHVKPIVAKGEIFDPNLHEALTQIPSADHPPMTILEEVERGYQMHDRVVRPGKVVVSAEVVSE